MNKTVTNNHINESR